MEPSSTMSYGVAVCIAYIWVANAIGPSLCGTRQPSALEGLFQGIYAMAAMGIDA